MTMKRLFAVVLALCLTASALCGCATEKPTDSTGAAQTSKGTELVYLLSMLEQKNHQGEVWSRTTYTDDDRGLVLTEVHEDGGTPVWNEEWGFYEIDMRPCDGVVDYQREFSYDEYGNPTKAHDASYEYTYDNEGKVTSFAVVVPDQSIDHTVEYDESGTLKFFQSLTDAQEVPTQNSEIRYDDAGRITQITIYEQDWSMAYQFKYDAKGKLKCCERIVEDPIMYESMNFTYDRAGRVLTADTFHGRNTYQYEDDFLVSINDIPLVFEEQHDGVMTVQYGNYVLTYTPVVLDKQDAAMARYRWNQFFGRRFGTHTNAGYPLCVQHPMFTLDTVLLLPREIF